MAKTHAITCSSVTEDRSLTFSYRNLSNFRVFYSRNGKSHKKSIMGWYTVGPSSNYRPRKVLESGRVKQQAYPP